MKICLTMATNVFIHYVSFVAYNISDCRGTGPLKTTMDVIDAAKVRIPSRVS